MELVCAIDLLDGGAVRLVQGDYDRRIDADVDPSELARQFIVAGCRRLHVIDLAGARAGAPTQLGTVGRIVRAARAASPDVVVEAGGGLRTLADVDALLAVADEALLGTAAIEQPGFLRACAGRHPGRVAVSLDLRGGRAALDGWSRVGPDGVVETARRLLDEGASRLIVTETSRDGTLAGPDLDGLARLRSTFPDAVLVAAGGVGSIDDLRSLRDLGMDGAVVGLALLTGAVDPAEAVAVLGVTLRKRIIACLDVTDGRVVKGTRFVDLVDAGDPVELATRYAAEGADEITILDIGATRDGRPSLIDLIRRAATALDVPLGVGGGVASLADAAALLDAGADKVAVNSAALRDPGLVGRLADRLGSQSVVIAIDAAASPDGGWRVRRVAGTEETGRDAVAWAREAVDRGAGEILLTSIDRDGTRSGYDLPLTRAVADAVRVPVIASGGGGSPSDVAAVLTGGRAAAALLASTLHFRLLELGPLKADLAAAGISVRPVPARVTDEEVAAWIG